MLKWIQIKNTMKNFNLNINNVPVFLSCPFKLVG